jgi:hypothetical protein
MNVTHLQSLLFNLIILCTFAASSFIPVGISRSSVGALSVDNRSMRRAKQVIDYNPDLHQQQSKGRAAATAAWEKKSQLRASNADAGSSSSSSAERELNEVRDYFNTEGFSRWNRIYSDSTDVNKVQLDIRTGHDQVSE